MDRDRPVRVRRGIIWFGAPALLLLIKLCVDAKDPSIVAQVRSELYTLTAILLQTRVIVRASPKNCPGKHKRVGFQIKQLIQSHNFTACDRSRLEPFAGTGESDDLPDLHPRKQDNAYNDGGQQQRQDSQSFSESYRGKHQWLLSSVHCS